MTITDPAQPGNGVSPRTAKRLREAMDRLLTSRPQRTDGRLIKDNLWKEAGVSRATMNRATGILADWNTRIAACDGFTPREARKNDELATLRAALAAKTRECTELARRRAAWTPPPPRYPRGYGALYAAHITQADQGCDFDFLAAPGTVPEPDAR